MRPIEARYLDRPAINNVDTRAAQWRKSYGDSAPREPSTDHSQDEKR